LGRILCTGIQFGWPLCWEKHQTLYQRTLLWDDLLVGQSSLPALTVKLTKNMGLSPGALVGGSPAGKHFFAILANSGSGFRQGALRPGSAGGQALCVKTYK
jgi:hypothetical protein